MIANHRQLRAHSGPFFEHWRRSVALAVGGALIEDMMQAEFAGVLELDGGQPTGEDAGR